MLGDGCYEYKTEYVRNRYSAAILIVFYCVHPAHINVSDIQLIKDVYVFRFLYMRARVYTHISGNTEINVKCLLSGVAVKCIVFSIEIKSYSFVRVYCSQISIVCFLNFCLTFAGTKFN